MIKKIILVGVMITGLGSTSSLPAQHEVNDQDIVDAKPNKVTESVAAQQKVEIDPLIKYSEVDSYDEIIREYAKYQERTNAAPTITINEERAKQQRETTERERVERLRELERERLAEVERQRVEKERLRVESERARERARIKNENEHVNARSQQSSTVKGTLNIEFSYYIALCDSGCTGKTATGIDVRNTVTYDGMRIIATDPNVIPTWSIVQFEMNGKMVKAIALDTGGAIVGHKVDMLVGTTSEAKALGRGVRKVEVLRYGK